MNSKGLDFKHKEVINITDAINIPKAINIETSFSPETAPSKNPDDKR